MACNKKSFPLIFMWLGRKTGLITVTAESSSTWHTLPQSLEWGMKIWWISQWLQALLPGGDASVWIHPSEHISLTSCGLTKHQGDREVESYHMMESAGHMEILCQQHCCMLKLRNCRPILLKCMFSGSL